MKENDIRPQHLLAGQKLAGAKDISRLLSKWEYFVAVACPACGGKKSHKKLDKNYFTYHECDDCATLYMNPRPSAKVLDWFYKGSANYDYWNKYIFPASEEARREKIFIPRVNKVIEYCEKYNINTDSLLEIGCAFGTFCAEMQARNLFKKIVGVEPTAELAQTSRQRGIAVIEEVIENINFKEEEKFDVVVNFEVIEHVFSPEAFIRQVRQLLKPGGLLMLTCPNGKGFDFTVLGEKCQSIDHEHLNYFNPKSLALLLEKCGLAVLEAITPGRLDAELVRNKIIDGTINLENQPFLKQLLIDEWETAGDSFQSFIAKNGLSSNMMIIARKK